MKLELRFDQERYLSHMLKKQFNIIYAETELTKLSLPDPDDKRLDERERHTQSVSIILSRRLDPYNRLSTMLLLADLK